MAVTMDPVSAGASLVGGILSYIGGNKANKQNIALQRETNALNYQMFKEQQAFDKFMFQQQLAYQDPSNLRKLLEDAGYNPASLVAGANSVLGSSPSALQPSPIAAQSPQVHDVVSPAVQVAAQGLNSVADAKSKLADAEGKQIDNSFKRQQWELMIDGLIKSNALTKEEAEKYAWDNLLTQLNFDALSKTANQTLYKLNADARLADATARLNDWLVNNKGPKEIEEINARISNYAAQQNYYEAQAYATRMGVPSAIAANIASAYRDKTQGDLNESQNEMTQPLKEFIGKKTKGDSIGSDVLKLLFLWVTGGKPG